MFNYKIHVNKTTLKLQEALALHVRLHTGDRTFVTDLCALTAALHNGNFLNPSQPQGMRNLYLVLSFKINFFDD